MRVTILGTGYVGLTTGVALAYLGHDVSCVDKDEEKIERLKQGEPPIYEPHLKELLDLSTSHLRFLSSYEEAVPEAEVVFISVGTPPRADGSPDLRFVRAAADEVGQHLGKGYTVVVNKSTVPIGSGKWVRLVIEAAYFERHGRDADGLVGVGSNPEFLRESSAVSDTLYPDRIVIGSEEARVRERLVDLYRPLID
jgi:UDPglucose 6-dehydrogenase